MNLLYVLGPLSLSNWNNNELRYSLRSVDSSGVAWVGIAGPEIPPFLSGVRHIAVQVDMTQNRYRNTQSQILAACQDPRVPEELILMNDDFMVQPGFIGRLPTHRGLVMKRITPNAWKKSIIDTCSWLEARGVRDPLNYEGHTPFLFLKSKAVKLIPELLDSKEILQFRTAYGNLNSIGGKLAPNAKRKLPRWPEGPPFWSLSSEPTDEAKAYLEGWLTSPSRWEAPNGISAKSS
jgi:hypothetical protein